jgi:hypothetical protein
VVAKAISWKVAGPVGSAKYSVTVSLSKGVVGSQVASEASSPPGGMVAEGCLAKVSGRIVPGWRAAPWAVLATDAPVICSGEVPKRFDSLMRTLVPPALIRTTCRRDWSAKPSRDQFGPHHSWPAVGCWWADAHTAAHGPLAPRSAVALAEPAGASRTASMAATRTSARRFRMRRSARPRRSLRIVASFM